MQAVAAGDQADFEQLVQRHQQSVWRIAYRMLGCRQTAEDIAQEAFLRLYRAARRYRPTATLRTYLYQVVTRLCLDSLRKKRPLVSGDLEPLSATGTAPEQDLLQREREQAVQAALNRLPPKQRLALVLRYYEGLGGREIAVAMGTSSKAIERLLARGRAALQHQLADFLTD
jgi:RNA polymerase sigma-70 factor (ECF subfamily)